MSTSVERVLNNPYLLADIMRHVAQVDKARNVLSTLCVSRAFRNPHVIGEALRSITYIYKPLREKVTSDSVMSCVDIDHVSGVVERSELKIDGLLRDGTLCLNGFGAHAQHIGHAAWYITVLERSTPGLFVIRMEECIKCMSPWMVVNLFVYFIQIGSYTFCLERSMTRSIKRQYTDMTCAEFLKWMHRT